MFDTIKLLKRTSSDSNFSLDQHIEAAISWLSQCQKMSSNDGASIRYSLIKGWGSSYPETTGYIIPTFFTYYDLTGDNSYKKNAIKMAQWELSIQQEDGSFIGGPLKYPEGKLVFDTGQIIFGLLKAFKYSQKNQFLMAAVRAADWLVDIQDKEGFWKNHSFQQIPHTYHSRVSWAIAQVYKKVKDAKYLTAVKNNIGWVLSNQLKNGWFNNAGFTINNHEVPYTHTIAYTIRGILEIGILLSNQNYINAAKKSTDKLIEIMNQDGFFWGKYNNKWVGDKKFSCLTGNAQISIICLRLYAITNKIKYKNTALALNKYLKSTQLLTIKNKNICGAIAGSYPIWGEYERFSFPNWATKFFIDALILEKKLNI